MTATPTSRPGTSGTLLLGAAAAVCLAVAVNSSPASIEQCLLGATPGRLGWGAQLFRALLAFHGLALLAVAARRVRPGSRTAMPAAPDPGPAPLGAGTWVALGLLCAVALALRLIRLNTDLWLDELLTFTDFAQLPLGEMVTVFPNQNQHMLYSVLASFTMSVFGVDAAGLRLPAVFFGVASLPVLFLLGRRTNGPREAWLVTVLMTVAYHHVWFSQNARGYSGLLFFTIASTWLLLGALQTRRTLWWVGYSAALALGLWVHMTMLFVAAAHAAAFALELALDLAGKGRHRATRSLLPILGAWFFGATVTAQLYALALPEFFAHALHEVSLESAWTDPLWVVREMVARLQDVGVVGIGAFLGLAAMGIGWWDLFRRDRIAGLSMLLPGFLGGGAMLALGHNLWPRFFFFCAGFILLTLARGAIRTPELLLRPLIGKPGARAWGLRIGTAGMALLIAVAAVTLPRIYAHPKQDYSGARDYVLEQMGEHDMPMSVGLAGTAYGRLYAPDWFVPERAEEIEAFRRTHDAIWLIYTLPIQLRAWHPDIWELIQREFQVVRVFPGTLGGGEVIVSRSRSDDADTGPQTGPGTGGSP